MKMKKLFGMLSVAAGLILVMLLVPKTANAAGVKINATNFPDQAFRHYISEYFDTDQNGELSEREIAAVTSMSPTYYWDNDLVPLKSLKGIEYFVRLESLYCYGDVGYIQLKSLDVRKNIKLKKLYISNNQLTSLNLRNNVNLEYLDCDGNTLKSLDLTNNTSLSKMNCSGNRLTSLKVASFFEMLNCSGNQLTTLDLSHASIDGWGTLDCTDNQLETLTLSNMPGELHCEYNKLTKLDLPYSHMGSYIMNGGERTEFGGVAYYEWSFHTIYKLSVDASVKLNVILNTPNIAGVVTPYITDITSYSVDYDYSQAYICWYSVPEAESYEIYRSLEGDKTPKKIGSTTATANTYTDQLPSAGNYVYMVRAKNGTYYSNFGRWREYDEENFIHIGKDLVYTYNPFTDVSSESSYFNSVMWAAGHGVVSGTTATTFSPDSPCTRYQFAVMIYRLAGKPAVSGVELPFSDVPANASYYNAVAWAYSNGIISGTSKTTFSPNDTVTRYQVVQMLYKMAGRPSITADNPFEDVPSDASFYKAVMWAVKNNITKGTSATKFSPYAPCKRSQMVVFLKKFNLIYKFK